MRSAAARGSAGVLAVLVVLAAVTAVTGRAAPRPQLPLHLLSVAAALRDAEQTGAGGAEQLSRVASGAALSGDATLSGSEPVVSGAGSLWEDGETEEAPLERPPRPAQVALASAEFSEYSSRTMRPRRSEKSRRRELRLDGEEYQFWLRSGGEWPTDPAASVGARISFRKIKRFPTKSC